MNFLALISFNDTSSAVVDKPLLYARNISGALRTDPEFLCLRHHELGEKNGRFFQKFWGHIFHRCQQGFYPGKLPDMKCILDYHLRCRYREDMIGDRSDKSISMGSRSAPELSDRTPYYIPDVIREVDSCFCFFPEFSQP